MPYILQLLQALRQAGWKVKIHDFERLEPPHITIYHKMRKWRVSLRDGGFLDRGDRWSQIEGEVRQEIVRNWDLLIREWDAIHPDNPVWGGGEND